MVKEKRDLIILKNKIEGLIQYVFEADVTGNSFFVINDRLQEKEPGELDDLLHTKLESFFGDIQAEISVRLNEIN